MKPFVLGVSGGSGSGKTYFASDLKKHLGEKSCCVLLQDHFYIDQSHRFDFDGGSVNFDHPSSIDFELLAQKLAELKAGQTAEIPIYEFSTHKRKKEVTLLQPKPLIIVDGILILHSEAVRKQLDDAIFFDTPEALRFERRLERDVKERGRTEEGVRQQFFNQVKPMHDLFVEPSKKYASHVVSSLIDYQKTLDLYVKKIQKIIFPN